MNKTETNKKIKLKPIPEVSKEYHFWDDGKSSPSRHYICRCERVIPYKEAKNIVFELKDYPDPKNSELFIPFTATLKEIWQKESGHCYWLFADTTECFVEISCPNYDENNLWAARTKDGGWFTLDIQSSWQGGEIDVTGEKFNNIIEEYKDEGNYDLVQDYLEETYE